MDPPCRGTYEYIQQASSNADICRIISFEQLCWQVDHWNPISKNMTEEHIAYVFWTSLSQNCFTNASEHICRVYFNIRIFKRELSKYPRTYLNRPHEVQCLFASMHEMCDTVTIAVLFAYGRFLQDGTYFP